jgi:hypothetical protein
LSFSFGTYPCTYPPRALRARPRRRRDERDDTAPLEKAENAFARSASRDNNQREQGEVARYVAGRFMVWPSLLRASPLATLQPEQRHQSG